MAHGAEFTGVVQVICPLVRCLVHMVQQWLGMIVPKEHHRTTGSLQCKKNDDHISVVTFATLFFPGAPRCHG